MSDRKYPLERVRNIGIIAHIDAGKTTTTERILYLTKRTHKIGNIDDGTTVMDWMEQEKARGITITSAATSAYWNGHHLNVIDTPGHVDFTVEVERSLRVLDGGVVVFDGVAGVEAQSETVWRQASRYGVPRICFINKMDRTGANYERTLGMITQRLKAKCLPLQIPIGCAETFRGSCDLLDFQCYGMDNSPEEPAETFDLPDADKERAVKFRNTMIERLAEEDDEVMEAYLAGEELPVEKLKASIRRVCLANKAIPIFCGTSLRNKGVKRLLDAVCDYLPSPVDIPAIKGTAPKTGEPMERHASDTEPFSALAFKIVSDPFVGRLVYFRIYSGNVSAGSGVYNSTRGERERIGRLIRMHANDREEIEYADAGEIVASLGLRNTFTGDTLCDQSAPILLESIKFPEPVINLAIEPKTRSDQDKMTEGLQKLAEEDPTFKVKFDDETGQTVIYGMGELHLDVLVSRLLSEFKVNASVGKPRVAYREAITAHAKAQGKFVRQSGGRGQYGDVTIEVEPRERGAGYEFVDNVKGGAVPRNFLMAAEAGIRETLETGVYAGYPMVDVKVTAVDGSYHDVDSNENAFKMAGSMAIKAAVAKAKPILLEPIMKLEAVTPEEYMGDVIGDFNSRRGQIISVEPNPETTVITGNVPLAESFGYTTDLRSVTKGRATFSMEFESYREMPGELANQVVEAAGKK
ncbi:MAG: elongation factor G [Dehalococcoides mccartyi]|uniref:elongation factor G n=1 Tax=Dehalococcoides mccartyi TaxID=61435 RepID=UPI0030FD0D52